LFNDRTKHNLVFDLPLRDKGRQAVEQICQSGPWARAVVKLQDGVTTRSHRCIFFN
jgi:hypothetical protein